MDKIRIRGGRPLKGEIRISGAKNAALPLMAASLLTRETLVLENLPQLADIEFLSHILLQHGVELEPDPAEQGRLNLTTATISDTKAPYELVRKMRASVLVLGPLLAREGHPMHDPPEPLVVVDRVVQGAPVVPQGQ